MADSLDAELNLDTSRALSDVEALGAAVGDGLSGAVDAFSASFDAAVSGLPTVDIEADATAVTSEVDAAVEAVDGTVPVEESGAEGITSDITSAVDDADATVEVEGDTGDLEQQLDAVAGSAASASTGMGDLQGATTGANVAAGLAGGSFSELGSAVEGSGGAMAAAAGAGIALGAAVGVMFNEAVEAEAAVFRLNSVFGAFQSQINTLTVGDLNVDLEQLAISLGSDDEAMRNAASNAGVMAQSFGYSQEQSAQLASGLLAISSRAVALNPALGDAGGAADRLLRALQSGRERALIPFQLGLTKTEISSRALQIAMEDGRSEATMADRAFAGVQLSVEKFGSSLNETIAKGTENPTLKLRALKTEVQEMIEAAGAPLTVPIIQIMEAAIPTLGAAMDIVAELAQAGLPILRVGLEALAPLLTALADGLNAIGPEGLIAVAAILGIVLVLKNLETMLLTARLAWMAMTTTMAINPIGLVLVAVGALVTALGLFSGGTDEAAKAHDQLVDSFLKGGAAIDAETEKTLRNEAAKNGLLSALNESGVSWAEYTRAINSASDLTEKETDNLQKLAAAQAMGGLSANDFVVALREADPALGKLAQRLNLAGQLTGDVRLRLLDAAIAMGQAGQQSDTMAASGDLLAESLSDVAAGAATYAADQQSAAAAATNASAANDRFREGTIGSKEATDALSASVNALKTSLDLLLGNYVSAQQAGLNYDSAIAKVTTDQELAAEGVGTFSEKARENYNAMLGATQAAISWSGAIAQAGGTTQQQLVPLTMLRSQLEGVRDQLIAAGADPTWVNNLLTQVNNAIAGVQGKDPEMQMAATGLGTAATTGVDQGAAGMPERASSHASAATSAITAQAGASYGAGLGIGQQATSGVDTGMDGLAAVATASTNEGFDAALKNANAHNVGRGIGVSFIDGIGEGVEDESGWLYGVIDRIIATAVRGARTTAEIASPSKLFAREVGLPIAQGIAVGISSQQGDVLRAARGVIDSAATLGVSRPAAGATTRIEFNISVAGVTDPATARSVGEQIGNGAADALARRGAVVAARVGG